MSAFLRGLLWLVVILALLFYLGGGWFFSEELRTDALEVDPTIPTYNLTITEVGNGTLSILDSLEGDEELRRPGVYGLDWRDGYGRIGEIVEEGEQVVTRRLTSFYGEPPEAGDRADFDGFAFPEDPLVALGIPFDKVEYRSPLGPIDAWFVPGTTDSWLIHVHGKGSSPREGLRMLEAVAGSGHPSLLINYRNDTGQPQDPSGFYQYGRTEWEDLHGAVQYASDHGATGVVLVGYSTGGGLILNFLYRSRLRNTVEAAVLDAPNIDFSATVDYGASQRTLPGLSWKVPGSLTWVAKQIAALRFDLDWEAWDYIAGVSQLDVPVLVFHGTSDLRVPIESSRRLARARPDLVTLVEVDGAGHVRSWNAGPPAYERAVGDFMDDVTR